MARLSLKGLTKTYPGGVKALDDFTLDIEDGEFLAVVGPSGCGKSTLLRIIAGLEEETSGSILLDGQTLNGKPPKDRDMAIMFQNYALFPHMTVSQNMAFGLRLRGMNKHEARRRVEDTAGTLGLRDLLQRLPSELSGGQRQRAALGRAMLREPKIFLFDEPLSNLDAQMRAQTRVEISRVHQSLHTTMIFVTHDQIEAMTMGDRIVVLKDGVIQQAADPVTLYEKPANIFVAGFIGSPGMNFFRGRLGTLDALRPAAGGAGEAAFLHDLFSLPLSGEQARRLQTFAGGEITLGLRPEDMGARAAVPSDGASGLRGLVTVVERLGGHAYLYLQAPGVTFTARVDNGQAWQAGQNADLQISASRAVFFDTATGAAIA